MKVYLDTEFNSFEGDLISIGMVSEDGDTFYAVRLATIKMDTDLWVQEWVMPHLHKAPHTIIYADDDLIQSRLEEYLNQWGNIELEVVADWPEDIQHLMKMLITGPGEMITTPHVVRYTVDRNLCGMSEVPHNAIFDAMGNMEAAKNGG